MTAASVPVRVVRRRSFRVPSRVLAGLVIVGGFALVALAAPLLAPYDPRELVAAPMLPPGGSHLLGTNDVGQDIFSELVYGARVSMVVALSAATIAVTVATVLGMVAGYLGGAVDRVVARTIDAMLSIPRLPFMLLIAAYAGGGLLQVVLIIAALSWPVTARLVRSEVLSLRNRLHVRAARGFGASTPYVLGRHILPAVVPVVAAAFALQAGRAVVMEAGLAFLGIGDPTGKSWGLTIRAALSYPLIYFGNAWLWWIVPAGLCIGALIVGFTLLGQGLEHWVNPRADVPSAT